MLTFAIQTIRVWCVPHQLDIHLKKATTGIDNGVWVATVYKLSVYLRAQLTFTTQIGKKCPKKTNRWMNLGSVLQYILKHELGIVEYLSGRGDVGTPPSLTTVWWLFTYAVSPIVERINETYEQLQDHLLVLSEQHDLLKYLVTDLIDLYDVRSVAHDDSYRNLPVTNYIVQNGRWIKTVVLVDLIEDQGSQPQALLLNLQQSNQAAQNTDEPTVEYVLLEFATFILNIIAAIEATQAERNSQNGAAVEEAPRVMPIDLVQLRPKDFVQKVLAPRRNQLLATSTVSTVRAIEAQQRVLYEDYKKGGQTKKAIERHTKATSFNQAWSAVGPVVVTDLQRFCCGVATVFPNTASVESDFSILKWEKDEFRTNLLDLSLEGIFQAKQHDILTTL